MQQDPYGDAESLFRGFYRNVVGLAYSLAGNKADAEDIAQESFCSLLSGWAHVVILPTVSRQRAYLTRIVINESLRVLKDPYRKRKSPGADIGEREALGEPMDAKVQAQDQLRFTWEAIAGLPEMRRTVIGLYAAGHEYEEIAAWLGISISAVRSHMSYARRQLRRMAPREQKGERG